VALAISPAIADLVGALTVAYDLLANAVFVPVVDAVLEVRATMTAAIPAMLAGGAVMVSTMIWEGLH